MSFQIPSDLSSKGATGSGGAGTDTPKKSCDINSRFFNGGGHWSKPPPPPAPLVVVGGGV